MTDTVVIDIPSPPDREEKELYHRLQKLREEVIEMREMKLVRICHEEYSGEGRICIRTLEMDLAQLEHFQALGMIELEGTKSGPMICGACARLCVSVVPWGSI